jgi:HEPN domain-containing protein
VKRRDFQRLATIRLKEANTLLASGHWEGAYYLGGYVVECALKACIARQTERHDFPDKHRAQSSHTHRIKDLVRVAGIEEAAEAARKTDLQFAANWQVVEAWSEQSRYEPRMESDARNLLLALRDRKHGVLRWLREHW